jgi:phage gpG-like protein
MLQRKGAGVLFSVEVAGETQVSAYLAGIADKVKNLMPIWPEIDTILRKSVATMFRREGKGRLKWDELADATQADRISKGFSPAHPILTRTGRLRRGATRPHGEHIFVKRKLSMDFGDTVPYGIYHQMSRKIRAGKGKLPRRPYIYIDKKDVAKIIGTIRRFVITGK